ncbi:MAG: hypothetical protein AVDCRST_MAG18-2219 [uncultured Thermomicrobiales bacterium]|uniref:Histidine kinase/HSP90-like ATPase domain-containing protein n=1 Tax=uncultured Thermomicrobiales bacterium TaxID=1645740 RepID=A0A6J4VGR7_9BACT|nr:MAG: hypothetical protein AVDCRST_MAG18-2219 [uncultured Thermomicrobiales bacterium]
MGAVFAHLPRYPAVRAARWIAWSLLALTSAQAAFGLSLATLNRLAPARLFAEYVVANVTAALAFATVGAIIVARRPGNGVGWLCCAAGVGIGVAAWTGQYARYALVTRPGTLPGGALVAWLNLWVWIPPTAASAVFLPLLFPNGRLPSARWRPLAWLGTLATALFTLSLILSPAPVNASLPEVPNPFAPAWSEEIRWGVDLLALLTALASLATGVAAAAMRLRGARGSERQQLKWVAYATALLVGAILAPAALDPSGFIEDTLLSGILLAVAFPALPAAIGIAVLWHRLYDIDLLLNRTLVYGALTAGVVGVYIFVVGYLGTLFRTGGNLAISLVATGLVAVLFQPLRAWLQRRVNRLLYGERDEPYAVIARLGRRLEATLDPAAALPVLVETVAQALKLPYAAITLAHDGAGRVAAAHGAPQPCLLRLPLTHGGETIGELALAPRAPDEPFSAADRRLLAELARQAGVAAHAVLLTADLERSRRRIVAAREEARRRLGNDLHDGLGHRLAALVRRAETASNLLDGDPSAAKVALDELTRQARVAVAEVRGLAHALHPPELELLGLAGALHERAQGYTGRSDDGVQVRVEVPEVLPPLPVAVEAAAYYIAQEALTNMHRHARARRCRVHLAVVSHDTGEGLTPALTGGRSLQLEITDDGCGLDAEDRAASAGLGLASMRERAAEVGGRCVVTRGAAGGTHVHAQLPIVE